MFTLSDARSAIANPAQFARGGVDVREGRVSNVSVEEEDGVLTYCGAVRGTDRVHDVLFEYDVRQEAFLFCTCSCAAGARIGRGCRHAAAVMIAVCGGAAESISAREGGEFIDALLKEGRGGRLLSVRQMQEPVRLYPVLARAGAQSVNLGLRIGRTRTYIVRSMTDFVRRARKRETTVYGRDLTFSHREAELSLSDAALFGQIVMLAGEEQNVRGAELKLSGAALDQTMRLLEGREVDVRGENGEMRRAMVKRSSLQIPLEMESKNERAELRVMADSIVLGDVGAYHFCAEEILCAYGQDFERIASLLSIAVGYPQGIRFDEKQLDRVCAQVLAPAMADVDVRKGQELVMQRLPMAVTPRLYVDKGGEKRLKCRVCFVYCGEELSPESENPHIRRNTVVEEDVTAMVQEVFPAHEGDGEYAFEGSEEACFGVLSEKLPMLETVGEVLVSERLTQTYVKKKRTMTLGVTREEDRLVLKADLGDYTQEDLDAALQAYRQKRRYVRLKSGTFLSGEALEQAADAAQVLDSLDMTAEEAKAGAEVPESRMLYLEEAVKARESIRLKAPKAIEEWTQRIRQAQQTRAQQPQTLRAQLRSYQLSGLCWLSALSDAGFNGILADDMGLGKTIQALSLLLREKEAGRPVRALVVCPASLQLNWKAEAEKFAPTLRCCALTGSARERAQIIDAQQEPELMITSYDQLRRDVQLYGDEEFTHVLLDEAQNIKNAASQAAQAVKTLSAQHKFAMTGTPIENRLSELWSIFDFLMPGYLLTYKKFKERFEAPIVRDGNEQARENLHLMVAPFILRRMKKDVLDDLPEKVETVMTGEMTPEQKKLYTAYAAQASGKLGSGLGGGKEQIEILSALTRLRQICCDPRLCVESYQGGSGKLTQLVEIVKEALEADHHILLFSQFTSMLDIIEETLRNEGIACFMLKGDTDKEERMRLVQRFNAGEADVFLISLKAGGTGLNLTGADVVIHYDPWWNVAAQNQATDRAYRIGQTKGVQVIKLIASGTVEEKILRLQESKRQLGDGVLLGEENLFTMDADTLREILG
ncbi:MAG: SNF2 helicase associated domain-containing protein [Clostridia bacterium]|nr:SNF2 helicase associated domain-containing protein [Clostridia bacterium]